MGVAPPAGGASPPSRQFAGIPGSRFVLLNGSVVFSSGTQQILVTYSGASIDVGAVGVATDGQTLSFQLPNLYNLTLQQPLTISVQGLDGCHVVDSSRFSVCPLPQGSGPVVVSFETDIGASGELSTPPGPYHETALVAGWNLVSDAAWLPLTGPIETLAGDGAAYVEVSPTQLEDDRGYWLSIDHPTLVTIQAPAPQPRTLPLPAGQWVMVGNSTPAPLLASGADLLEVYVPGVGYEAATELEPGQGAFAYAAVDSELTLTPAPP